MSDLLLDLDLQYFADGADNPDTVVEPDTDPDVETVDDVEDPDKNDNPEPKTDEPDFDEKQKKYIESIMNKAKADAEKEAFAKLEAERIEKERRESMTAEEQKDLEIQELKAELERRDAEKLYQTLRKTAEKAFEDSGVILNSEQRDVILSMVVDTDEEKTIERSKLITEIIKNEAKKMTKETIKGRKSSRTTVPVSTGRVKSKNEEKKYDRQAFLASLAQGRK